MAGFFIFSGAQKTFAAVYKISFASDIQNLDVGATSSAIKIEPQDSSGTSTKATETIYLNLSTSGSGEFSSNNTTWKSIATLPGDFSTSSIFISSSSASRSFYYKGFSEGQHTITVSAKSKSGIVYSSISQVINIGVIATTTDNGSGGTGTTTATSTQTSTSTTDTESTSSQITRIIVKTVYISTHSGEEDLSDFQDKSVFVTSAGRQRIAYIGSPIEFSANYKVPKNMEQNATKFTWSFGDGLADVGDEVTHTYKYPGEYNIILNGESGTERSVSRTMVKVLAPNIIFEIMPDGGVNISNMGNTEINLGSYELRDTSSKFIFPQDTIVGAGKNIMLSSEDIKIQTYDQKISLNNPSGGEVFIIDNIKKPELSVIDSSITIVEAEVLYSQYKKSLALQNQPKKEILSIVQNENSLEEDVSMTATVFEASSSVKIGFWKRLFGLPVSGAKAVFHLFYQF